VVKQASVPDAGTVPDAKPPVDAMAGTAADAGVTADGPPVDSAPVATTDGQSTVDPIVPKPSAGGGCSCQTIGPASGNWMWLFGFTLVLAHRTRAARRRSAHAGRRSVG
jgi:MYXO-CTERM domain-containing protein